MFVRRCWRKRGLRRLAQRAKYAAENRSAGKRLQGIAAVGQFDFNVIARLNPTTGDVESLEVLFFSARLLRSDLLELPVKADFQTFLETVPDAMVVVDGHGRIAMVNTQAERLFGYSREHLLGLQVEVLVPARYQGAHGEHRQAYLAAPSARPMGAAQELYGRRKDGSEFPVEISLSPIESEQGLWVASAIRDITDRKRAETQRVSLIREHAARREAEAANRAKDEFLAILSHELRNPLGAVLTAVAVLEEIGVQKEPAVKARAIIARQAQRLSRLLDDLLDVARLQTGKVILTTQHLDLADLVQRCLGTLRASGALDQHDVTADSERT